MSMSMERVVFVVSLVVISSSAIRIPFPNQWPWRAELAGNKQNEDRSRERGARAGVLIASRDQRDTQQRGSLANQTRDD